MYSPLAWEIPTTNWMFRPSINQGLWLQYHFKGLLNLIISPNQMKRCFMFLDKQWGSLWSPWQLAVRRPFFPCFLVAHLFFEMHFSFGQDPEMHVYKTAELEFEFIVVGLNLLRLFLDLHISFSLHYVFRKQLVLINTGILTSDFY